MEWFVCCKMAKQKRKESEVAEKKSKKLKKVSAVEMPVACAVPPGTRTAPAEPVKPLLLDEIPALWTMAKPRPTQSRWLSDGTELGISGVCIRVPVPGGAEGPGEKAEEGAEERSTEAAAGGGHRCGSKPCSQALRGRAGPGVPVQVPDEHFPALLAYLEGLRGRARELTVQKAEALMRELDEAGAVALPPGGTQRARQVLQLLS
ncbi:uncharacterized protein C7orf50 homolog isoform X5 [Bubalus bubalis]|uniref:uncharacterized protein C7orf50 homolog isoform X5 n=1 Tax=Bubalus bubalis TaxID=89462 RepID=UPI001E1B7EAC|nr:uncharacterized protein C7orf50 homolog isoform X5 [Bubalus bubalis]XP_044792043.2 uncharacterized protein C7orf50 homolog isoform X5 [Bubalus bubalis]